MGKKNENKIYKFDKFIKENKYLLIICASVIGILIIILMLIVMYCCSSHIVSRNITKLQNNKNVMLDDAKLPIMNSIIEKTMNNMRKVKFKKKIFFLKKD